MTTDNETEETRWWWDVAPSLGEPGHLKRVSEAVGFTVAGIVDEQAGGIVAYAHADHARTIVNTLNEGGRSTRDER